MIDPLIALVISAPLALLFFMAARHKMASTLEFKGSLAAYEILPDSMISPVAGVLPYIEMAVAILILIPATRELAAFVAIVLLSVYALAMAVNILRGRSNIDCGCGGQPQFLSVWLLLRNAVLIAGGSLLLFPASDRAMVWADFLFLILMTTVLAMTYLLVEQLVRNHNGFTDRSSSNG